jgi:hypothetical protein
MLTHRGVSLYHNLSTAIIRCRSAFSFWFTRLNDRYISRPTRPLLSA